MLKSKYWCAILPATLVLGIPFSAVARIGLNGTSLVSMISPNGVPLISLISPNGIAINGTALQSFTTTNQGVLRAENGRLVIQTSPTAP